MKCIQLLGILMTCSAAFSGTNVCANTATAPAIEIEIAYQRISGDYSKTKSDFSPDSEISCLIGFLQLPSFHEKEADLFDLSVSRTLSDARPDLKGKALRKAAKRLFDAVTSRVQVDAVDADGQPIQENRCMTFREVDQLIKDL